MSRTQRLLVCLRWDSTRRDQVGELAQRGRQTLFQFSDAFLDAPLPLSPFNLPVKPGVHEAKPRPFVGLHGVFDDGLPDAWGRLLIDRRVRKLGMRPAELSTLDRLAYVGDSGIGALTYEPAHDAEDVPGPIDLDRMAAESDRVLRGTASDVLDTLVKLGGSPGGTRPKVMVARAPDGTWISGREDLPNCEQFLVKFPAPVDPADIGPIEHAYAEMARASGIEVPPTELLPGKRAPHFAIRRFDRSEGSRLHAHTLSGLLHADHTLPALDYDHLLRVTGALTRDKRQMEAAFRRACFNVFAHNRDDHGKQFTFLMDATGKWRLAPAYDLTFSEGPGGEHSTTVEGEGRAPGDGELRALGSRHGVDLEVINAVREAVGSWARFASAAGVTRRSAAEIGKQLQAIAS